MPNRMLRDWTDSLRFEGLSAESERLFVRLIMKADDYGRYHADPRLVRAACYPLEDCTTATVAGGLEDLAKRGLLHLYEVERRPYLAIVNYGQRLKQSLPKFPPPEGEADDWKPTSGQFREVPARSGSGSGSRSGSRSGSGSVQPAHPSGGIVTMADAVHELVQMFPNTSESVWMSELAQAQFPQDATAVQEFLRDESNATEPSRRPTARLRAYLRNASKYRNGTFKEAI